MATGVLNELYLESGSGKKELTSWHKKLSECINHTFQAVSNGQTETIFHTRSNFL